MGLWYPDGQDNSTPKSLIILHDAEKGECLIIDVAIPADKNIADKEVEKISKYAELKVEISRTWDAQQQKLKLYPLLLEL